MKKVVIGQWEIAYVISALAPAEGLRIFSSTARTGSTSIVAIPYLPVTALLPVFLYSLTRLYLP